jgi:hypothetical protein
MTSSTTCFDATEGIYALLEIDCDDKEQDR